MTSGRRRRIARLGAAALSAILALSACRSPASRAPVADPSPAAGDAFALWPEETPAEAAAAAVRLGAGEDPWRADPTETALAFAAAVLGWERAVAGPVREQPGGLSLVDVSREPGGPSVSVRLARIVGDRWWSVYNAWGSVEEDPSVVVRDGRIRMRFDMEDAASALVIVEYGDARHEREVAHGRARFDLGRDPTEPGYFLVLLRDPEGRVFDAVSSPLPPGDFAAG